MPPYFAECDRLRAAPTALVNLRGRVPRAPAQASWAIYIIYIYIYIHMFPGGHSEAHGEDFVGGLGASERAQPRAMPQGPLIDP